MSSDNQTSVSLWQVIKSVAASAFGVQSQKNYQRDFSQTSFVPFVVVGILFVVLFILMLVVVVRLIFAG